MSVLDTISVSIIHYKNNLFDIKQDVLISYLAA